MKARDLERALGTTYRGEPHAAGDLFHLLYSELHRQAARLMSGQPAGHTLQATALLHETFLRIRDSECKDHEGFLGVAARAMRTVLVDHARRKSSLKRFSHLEPVPFDDIVLSYEDRAIDLLELEEALKQLEAIDPQMVAAAELRFFAGLSMEEAASAIGMPARSFRRRWQATRAYLYRHLR
jgi:RNA polymerase sigma factor (TIGR02999 family)